MEIRRYEFILRAAEPIAHHSETLGNEAILMRRKVRVPGGRMVDIAEITGDTMRHGLREAAAYAYLDAAGMLDKPDLSEAALRLIFAGGMVTGKGSSSSINLDIYRKMTELMPPLRLLGGCADNRVIPGYLECDGAILICDETRKQIEECAPWVLQWLAGQDEATNPARSHVVSEQRVRMDPMLVPEKRMLMSADAQVAVNRRLESGERAHVEDDAVEAENAKSSMLPRRYETLVQGSLLYWSVTARCYSPLDVDTFLVMVLGFLANARVGGKKATGHGRIIPIAARQIDVVRPSERATEIIPMAMVPKVGKVFREHVEARRTEIAEMLRTVAA